MKGSNGARIDFRLTYRTRDPDVIIEIESQCQHGIDRWIGSQG